MHKTLIVTAALLLSICAGAAAQQKDKALEKHEANRAELNLSAEQKEKVRVIDSVFLKDLAALKNTGGSKISRLKKFKNINAEKDKKMKAVLNAEQYRTYAAQQKEMKEAAKQKYRNR